MESEEDDIFDEEEINRNVLESRMNLPTSVKLEELSYYSESHVDSNFFIKIEEVDDIHPKIEPTEGYEIPVGNETNGDESCNSQQLEALFKRRISKRHTKFLCILCRKSFQYASTRNSHFGTHFGFSITRKKTRSCSWFFGKYIFTCNFCGQFYLRKVEILNHCQTYFFTDKKEKHLATENKSIIQNILDNIDCKNNISEFLHETSHIKLEPEENLSILTSEEISPHQCGYCLKRFKANDDLAFHLQCSENIFNCPICRKQFAERERLKSHLLLHTKQKLFKCVFCSKQFIKLANLTLHVTLHANSRMYECDVCLKKFFRETQLICHKSCHEVHDLFKCKVCYKQFSKKSSLKHHLVSHDAMKMCSKLFSEANSLKLHMNNNKKKCTICSKHFSTHNHLKEHAVAHQHDKSFKCEVCKRSFKLKISLINHICDYSKTGKLFKCDNCCVFFSTKKSARNHNCNSRIKVFACDICPRRFTNRMYLKDHQLSHTRDKPHQCHICLKLYRYIQDLNRHLRSHAGEKPFTCDVCFKQFTHKGHLNRHMHVLHDAAKPPMRATSSKTPLKSVESLLPRCVDERFACDFCGLECTKRATLNYHLLSHSSVKFVCADCSKEFKRKGDLRKHIVKVHMCQRSANCTVCDKTFKTNWDLKVHLRVHTGEKPHQCKLCGKSFTVIQNLHSHVRRKHGSYYDGVSPDVRLF